MANDTTYNNVVCNLDFSNPVDLDQYFISEHLDSPTSHMTDRIRENAIQTNGELRLYNRLVDAENMLFTACSLRLKTPFTYGMVESEMKISTVGGINNSIWMRGDSRSGANNAFEIDVQEGKFPNVVDTNVHDWSVYPAPSIQNYKGYQMTKRIKSPISSLVFDKPKKTRRLRLSFSYYKRLHVAGVMIFNGDNTVNMFDQNSVTSNLAFDLLQRNNFSAFSSSHFNDESTVDKIWSGTLLTNKHHLIFDDSDDKKNIVIEFNEFVDISSIHVLTGWGGSLDIPSWQDISDNVKFEYADPLNDTWTLAKNDDYKQEKLSEYKKYRFLWDDKLLKWYVDGKLIRVERNIYAHEPAHLLLSTFVGIDSVPVTLQVADTYMAFKSLKILTI
ncbi:MAG TPA: hypothetical protein DEF78_07185 [Sphingobacterium sp.]|nr:hypothetical protein [Sphingobacterium sp.]